MRSRLTIAVLLVTGASALRAQSAVMPSVAEAVRTVNQIENEWGSSFVRRDSTALGRLIHRDFVGVYPTRWFSKADFLRDAARVPDSTTSRMLVESLPDPSRVVRVFGPTAVVHGMATHRFREPDGRSSFVRTSYTETFVFTEGRWQCVAGQYSPVYEPPTAGR